VRYLSVLRHIHVGRRHTRERIRLLLAGPRAHRVREDGTLLPALTLERDRLYFGNSPRVHNDARQASGMS